MKRASIATVTVGLIILACCVSATGQTVEEMAQYKAGLLVKLVEYVTWPDGSGPAADESIVIGVWGDSPMLPPLKQLANFSALNPKPEVKKVVEGDDLSAVHLMFIPTTDEAKLDEILAAIGDQKILTMSDCVGFGNKGVMVNFAKEVNAKTKEKFEVNLTAVKGADLKISSKFLKLAKIIEG